jgi:flagellar basal body-associated protein FliL
MSHTAKGWTAIIVIIVVIVIVGAWYSMSHSSSSPAVTAPVAQTGTTYQVSSDTSASASSQSNTSDAALQGDLNSTDYEMNTFNADTAASAQ